MRHRLLQVLEPPPTAQDQRARSKFRFLAACLQCASAPWWGGTDRWSELGVDGCR